MRRFLKRQWETNTLLWRVATRLCSLVSLRKRVRGARNRIELSGVLSRRVRISVTGSDNLISLGPGCILTDLAILIKGSGCRITVGPRSILTGALICEDNGSSVDIGERTTSFGAEIAATEGRAVRIGDGCLFSSEIVVRNGDSHSVLDASSGSRLNPAADIAIGNHVWLGRHVTVLKGATIGDGSVVGAASLVTKAIPDGCAAAGVPAKVLRTGVRWCGDRSAPPQAVARQNK